jgi:N-acetylmuramoyl-L-alanine amidase
LKHPEPWQRLWRYGAVFFLLAIAALPAVGRTDRSEAWAREQFASAERMRESLNGRPAKDRGRSDYQRVINAYRRVYYGRPTSSQASSSVVAVAELLAEMGRRFDDDRMLRSAIGQYKFLRREYPGSNYRFEGLFTIGEIYKDDLNDPRQARQVFADFLRRYPHHHLAEQARSAIAELDQIAETAKKAPAQGKSVKSSPDENSDEPESPSEPGDKGARVTGVRHWSTPSYTRVAIDLEQDVKFDSQRLDHPERIFFDLYDTKLASTLVGKSFDVDDGFLKKIRIAQFEPGRTRVVLEVDDLAEYSAFLLSNPSRLIIDVRGQQLAKNAGAKDRPPSASAKADSETEPKTRRPAAADETSDESSEEPIKVWKVDSKAPAQVKGKRTVASSRTLPKKIVVVDDNDVSPASDETASDKASERKTTAERRKSSPAVSTHRKRAAADGNNDEVATLDPLDTEVEGKASATRVSSTSLAKGRARRDKRSATPAEPELEVHEAQPTASGDRSLIRALGLKIGRIVIDPGHGGHDTGTIGPNGLEEKDLVLDVAKRLGKLLQARLGAEVIYTRQDDTFIPLETRTAIANQEQADLFVSIHANSSHDPDARGVETYYLNFTSNSDALEVAARENAVSDKSIHELQDLVKKIALKEKIEESREFASDVQRSLHTGLAVKSPGIRDRGVKKAPFIVLIGANMPSILAEISFVSNPTDARKLRTAEYRQRIAESLYKGISKYASGLSGVKVASGIAKNEGQ